MNPLRTPLLVLGMGLLAAIPLAPATAAGPTSLNCSDAAVRSAIAAGGSYKFVCDGTITLGAGGELVVTKNVSLDATGHTVAIDAGATGPPYRRAFKVTGGTLTLVNLTVQHGFIYRTGDGEDGQTTNGQGGSTGGPGAVGGTGSSAPPVTQATNGADQKGGCIYIEAGAGAVLRGGAVSDCTVIGGHGGDGADGGSGGYGGDGGDGANGGPGGNGGTPGSASAAGRGGDGGDALGGGIYNAGTLSVSNTVFANDAADAGWAGWGGRGGDAGGGGKGGNGGAASSGKGGAGGKGGTGTGGSAPGGDGGNAGDGKGGGIYSRGTTTISGATFTNDAADGGCGGEGG
ncbi:MAG: hypothetical protein QOG86_335, partial [Thermoleophilaceae bacterium]|nr:hypothetical protein [Thermoleophilaceae bacterium]